MPKSFFILTLSFWLYVDCWIVLPFVFLCSILMQFPCVMIISRMATARTVFGILNSKNIYISCSAINRFSSRFLHNCLQCHNSKSGKHMKVCEREYWSFIIIWHQFVLCFNTKRIYLFILQLWPKKIFTQQL